MALFVHNYRHFSKKSEELKVQIEENSLKKVACISEIARLELRLSELKQLLDEADPELHALTEEITLVREKLAASEASLTNARKLLETEKSKVRALSEELQEEEDALAKIRTEALQAEERLTAARLEKEALEEGLEELSTHREIADEEDQVYQSRIGEMKEEKQNLDRLLENHRIRRENLEREYATASRLMNEQTEKVLTLEEELSREQIMFEGRQLKLAAEKKGISQEAEKREALELRLSGQKDRLKSYHQRYDQSRSGWFTEKARLQSLQELDQHSEGWVARVRSFQQDFPGEPWVLLSDMISLAPGFHDLPDPIRSSLGSWSERLLLPGREGLDQLSQLCLERRLGGVPASLYRQQVPEAFIRLAEQWQLAPLAPVLLPEKADPGLTGLLSGLWYKKSPGTRKQQSSGSSPRAHPVHPGGPVPWHGV